MEYYDKRRGEGQKATPPPPLQREGQLWGGGGGFVDSPVGEKQPKEQQGGKSPTKVD